MNISNLGHKNVHELLRGSQVIVLRGPDDSSHSHPLNRVETEKIKLILKRKAEAHSECPPSAILLQALAES